MNILVSKRVQEKLNTKHGGITPQEIRECFANRSGNYRIDSREEHLTNPLTRWFIAETNRGRKLKICFIPFPDHLAIKTAFEPNEKDIAAYGDI